MALTRMKVFLFLADPPGTLAAGFDRIKIQVSEDFGTTWAEHSDVDTRLVIESDKYNYHYILKDGDPNFRYRAVLSAADGSPADAPQPPTQAIDVSFESLISVEELKEIFLFSIDLTGDDGTPYPDELFAHYIQAAISQAEIEFDIIAFPRKFTKEKYDWWRKDWEQLGFVKLRDKPVISVEACDIRYPNQPDGVNILSFPKEWIVLDKHAGTFNVYPGNGVLSQAFISQGGGYIPLIMGGADFLPGLLEITYFAGMDTSDRRRPMLKEYVGKRASFGPLNIAGDLVAGAGLAAQSISIDGLSRNITTTNSSTNAGYGARILQYTRELKEMKPVMMRHFGGLKIGVV